MFDSVEGERKKEEEHSKILREEKNKLTLELGQLKRTLKDIQDKNQSLSQERLDLNERLVKAENLESEAKKAHQEKELKLQTGSEEISKLKQSISVLEQEKAKLTEDLKQANETLASKTGCCSIQ